MTYSALDMETFRSFLSKHLKELAVFFESEHVFTMERAMAVVGYHMTWRDSLSSIDRAVSFAQEKKQSEGAGPVALCPAGGVSREILDTLTQRGIRVQGVVDSYKAGELKQYHGIPLYPLTREGLDGFDAVIVSSQAYAEELFDCLSGALDKTRQEIHVPFVGELIDRQQCETHILRINELCKDTSRKTIVYAVDCLYMHNLKRIAALRENGFQTILLTRDDTVSHSHPLDSVSGYFDYMCCTHWDGLALLYILNRIHPDIVHLAPVVRHYESTVLMHAVSQSAVVCEFYDILLSIHTHEDYTRLFGGEQADIQFFCEHYLCKQADGIMYKSSGEEGKRLLSYHGSGKPGIQFQNYISLNQCKESQPWNGKRRLRIVYSGSVHARGIQNHGSSLLDIIPEITGQNMRFDLYNVHDSGDPQYDDYRNAASGNPLFTYHLAVKNKDIVSCLSEYDLGWQVIDIKHSKQNLKHFETAINAKFFDYISAGLPIVVSEEYRYMADLVRTYSMGVVIRHEHIKNLFAILEEIDVNSLKRNVATFRKQWSMEENIHRLISFYSSMTDPQSFRQKAPSNKHSLAS